MVKITNMSTSIVKHIVLSDADDAPTLTFYLNDKGDVFMHEDNGEDITNFWRCIPYEEWLEVVKFIDQQKKESNV